MSIRFLLFILLITNDAWAVPELGQKIMITSTSREASEAGMIMARKGGNAVDAAVATVLALAVTRPYYAALGGGGFALIKMNKQIEALDFRETAPAKTSEKYYLSKAKNASTDGGTAVGVPGLPLGLFELHKKYGKLHWSELFVPAIKLANEGFQITGEWSEYTLKQKAHFNDVGLNVFFKSKTLPYKPGDVFIQKDLASLLKEIQTRGVSAFYSGLPARDIADTVQAAGGDLTFTDLKNYKVRWLKPMEVKFDGFDIYLMPPPSSGGLVIATALKLAEKLKLKDSLPLSLDELHLIGEILNRSFRGRSLLGDPDFNKNPLEKLLSDKYIEELKSSISHKSVKKLDPLNETQFTNETETTHVSVMTANGDGVALTVTLNGSYGSGVVTRKYKIVLNNEMDDFTTRPNEANAFGLIQGTANNIAPGKRPLSSMSPTLVLQNGKLREVVGAPGGPRIISAVFQVLYRTLISGWNMDKSIQAPRVHNQFLPHKLFIDPNSFSPETIEGLKKKGHDIVQDSAIAKVYGVQLNKDGLLEGAFDSRGDGAAVGY